MAVFGGELPHNMSIDTDPQQQAAASPLMLVVRSFLRYAAGRRVRSCASSAVGS